MRIAQVAPLHEACPPRLYGGTERVVTYLAEALVRQGHDVTLFASGDSDTSARLEAVCAKALRLDANVFDPLIYHMIMFNRVAEQASRFDGFSTSMSMTSAAPCRTTHRRRPPPSRYRARADP